MNIEIREFQPGDEVAFRALNEAWIIACFILEDKDRSVLGNPQQYILDFGGHIYFAVHPETGEVLGCCAPLAIGDSIFEVGKMAVAEDWRGQGVGRKLLRGVIATARALGTTRLYLETNHSLKNAIQLYTSEGFQHLRPADVKPTPYIRSTVFMELYL